MARLFGTDGERGLANQEITAELALQLGIAAASVLTARADCGDRRPKAIVGRDSRLAGQFLAAATMAGLSSAGVDVEVLGVLPTPAVAYLTAAEDADLAVMISASHNPMADNGIKFFARGGYKLDDAVEDEVEAMLDAQPDLPTGADVGRIELDRGLGADRYVEHRLSTIATQTGRAPGRGGA